MTNRDDEIAALQRRLDELKAGETGSTEPSTNSPSGTARTKTKRPRDKLRRQDWLIIGGIATALGVVALITTPGAPPASPQTGPNAYTPTQKRIAEEATLERERRGVTPLSDWSYRDDKDEMTDKLTRLACTTSTNQAVLSWPYRPVSARLCIRQSPRHGLDAYLVLNGDGQILCRSYDGCTIKVRFGDGTSQSFSANGAADGSSNIVFLASPQRFITGVKSASQTRVELLFYEAGNQALTFETANLEWPRPTPVAK